MVIFASFCAIDLIVESPAKAPFSSPFSPLAVSSEICVDILFTSTIKLSRAVKTLSLEVEIETKASVVVVVDKVKDAPSITSFTVFVGLVIETPSTLKLASIPATVSVLVLIN